MNSDVPRLKRVLCALDVDDSTQAALEIASAIAEGFQASADALYAPAPLFAFGGRAERVRRLIAEHNARERLQAMLVPFVSNATHWEPYVTRGLAGDVILSHSERRRSDLIVLGQRSGAVSASVASAAGCAVLTVHGQTPERALRRVLLPLGSSLAATCATSWAIALAERFQLEIDVVRIVAPRSGFWRWGSASVAPLNRSELQMHSVAKLTMSRLNAAGIPAKLRSETFDTGEVIELAASGAFDLVVTGLQQPGDVANDGEAFVRELRRASQVSVLSARSRGTSAFFARGPAGLAPDQRQLSIPA
jgi:nucleotide-binding universal stress UspA family protein